jgi:hypothetical protein
MATNYMQKYLKDIVGGITPDLKRSRDEQIEWLGAQSLRTGQPMAQVASAMRPFADAAGDAAAKAGVQASQMAQKQEQFDTQQQAWEKNFNQGQENWQASFDQRNKDQEMQNMMNVFATTGKFTPEMLDAFGYGDMSFGDQRKMQQQMSLAGLGGSGSTGGGSTFGSGNPYPGQHQFYRNKAGSQFGGATGLVYAS